MILSISNCCHWPGVVCNNVTAHVVQLHLNTSYYAFYYDGDYGFDEEAYERFQFGGEISPCLADLKHLNFFDFSGNDFEGTIPTSLGNLTSLVERDLSSNQLEGTIPTSLGNLCNLRDIDFSYLKLNQQVNDILKILVPCISHGLTSLAVQSSQLSGNLTDQIGAFKTVEMLVFYSNSIGGAIPRSFGKLSTLRYLDLSINKLSGNPFESLTSFSKLSYLGVDGNNFQGVVKEDDLANLTSLTWFHA
ncbi:Receptor-like protein 35 [Glycine soja]|uniref:Receptor-like protein 35 n=1 Tax=Glycine soja TaxID=3848 RepID=A0A445EY52_GLYSO|nr:Receptor-like protein 35 [Glycine soja]